MGSVSVILFCGSDIQMSRLPFVNYRNFDVLEHRKERCALNLYASWIVGVHICLISFKYPHRKKLD